MDQSDTIVPELEDPASLNRYSYGKNNPQRYVDPGGHNPFDILILSLYGLVFTAGYNAEAGNQVRSYAQQNDLNAERLWVQYRYAGRVPEEVGINHEACVAAGFNAANTLVAMPSLLLAPVASLTTLPGELGEGGEGLDAFSRAKDYGIRPAGELKEMIEGTGLFVHHLIDQRFAETLSIQANDIPSIALTQAEHQVFTNLSRQHIGYDNMLSKITTSSAGWKDIWEALQGVYADYPQLLEAVRQFLSNESR